MSFQNQIQRQIVSKMIVLVNFINQAAESFTQVSK